MVCLPVLNVMTGGKWANGGKGWQVLTKGIKAVKLKTHQLKQSFLLYSTPMGSKLEQVIC